MRIGDRVQISPQALQVKAIFPDRPGDDIVEEILEFIRVGNPPHEWRGHTHTKPPQGAPIMYIGGFDLDRDRAAPCPCCSSGTAKYFKDGKIAYFPDEQVVRMIGPDCFATLNPEGHEEAMKQYMAEKQRKREIDYILANITIAPELERVLEEAIPLAEAVDTVRNTVSDGRLDEILGVELFPHMGAGVLSVTTERQETYVDSYGETGTRTAQHKEEYARIAGPVMVRKSASRFVNQLKHVLDAIRKIPAPDPNRIRESVEAMDETSRAQVARLLGNSVGTSRSIWKGLDDARSFFSPGNIATINGWGRHPDSPVQIEIRREGRDVTISRPGYNGRLIRLPEAFDKVLDELPKMETKP